MIPSVTGAGAVAILVTLSLGASPGGPGGTAERVETSQAPILEPSALLTRYESGLAPYIRMKGRWSVDVQDPPRGSGGRRRGGGEEWKILREGNRAWLAKAEGDSTTLAYEAAKHGECWISIYPSGEVFSRVSPVARDDFEHLGMLPSSPSYGIIDQRWIPGFLRAAKLSAWAENLDGHSLSVLRGVDSDVQVAVWLDPGLGYVARRVRLDKKASEADPTVRTWQFDVIQFRKEGGHNVVGEATSTFIVGPQPLSNPRVVEKVVDGKGLRVHEPARDDDGKVIMVAQRKHVVRVSLIELRFNPQETDEHKFRPRREITNGTTVHMKDDSLSRYEWRDGAAVLVESKPNRPQPPAGAVDAEGLLRQARKKSMTEGKKILVHLGFPACGWCRVLDGFLEANGRLFEDRFVLLKIDVEMMAKGDEIAARLQEGTDRLGYPWIAVLDTDGRVITTSVRPNGENIGCPVLPNEIDHFVKMLRGTDGLPESRLAEIRESLETHMKPYRDRLPVPHR